MPTVSVDEVTPTLIYTGLSARGDLVKVQNTDGAHSVFIAATAAGTAAGVEVAAGQSLDFVTSRGAALYGLAEVANVDVNYYVGYASFYLVPHVGYHKTGGSDALAPSDIGAVSNTGDTIVGVLVIQDAATPTKGYRLRPTGGGTDFEGSGSKLIFSVWSDANFTGTQRTYMVLENGAQVLQLCKDVQFRDGPDGNTRHRINGDVGGGVVFNEDGADADTRIEGDTDQNLVFVDASTDFVGIGTNAPAVKFDINSDNLRVRTQKTPASASAAGVQGQWCNDANFLYVCTATNTWKRAALSTW